MNASVFCQAPARRMFGLAYASLLCVYLTSCAGIPQPQPKQESAVPRAEQKQAQSVQAKVSAEKRLKRKLAIGRFTDQSKYGSSVLLGVQLDPLGKKTSDMLSGRLNASGRFYLLERPEMQAVKDEQAVTGEMSQLVGAEALLVGSVTEFGRSTEGQTGFLSANVTQKARAKVEVRLVDVKTGRVFFNADGTGEATSSVGNVAGWGTQAGYDSTLDDKAIGAALDDLIGAVMNKLEERPWRAAVLGVQDGQLIIGAGKHQGVTTGERLALVRPGKKMKNPQTGFDVTLPGQRAGYGTVTALFGESDTDEGALLHMEDALPKGDVKGFYVEEVR